MLESVKIQSAMFRLLAHCLKVSANLDTIDGLTDYELTGGRLSCFFRFLLLSDIIYEQGFPVDDFHFSQEKRRFYTLGYEADDY